MDAVAVPDLQADEDCLALLLLHWLLQLILQLGSKDIDLGLLISFQAAAARSPYSLTQIAQPHAIQAQLSSALSHILHQRRKVGCVNA